MNKTIKKNLLISLITIILFAQLLVGSVYADQKVFTAVIAPNTVDGGSEEHYTITISNLDLNPSKNKLGSVTVSIPPEFALIGEEITVSHNWKVTVKEDEKLIEATAVKSPDCIRPGEVIEIGFSATAPIVQEIEEYEWTTNAYTSPAWAGDKFISQYGQQPIVTVNPTHYTVHFEQEGLVTEPTVKYSINDGVDIERTVSFDVSVNNGDTIYYEYEYAVFESNKMYVLESVNPESPKTVESEITITGIYKLAFELNLPEGSVSNIRSNTVAENLYLYSEIPLTPLPDTVIGPYFTVELTETAIIDEKIQIIIHYTLPEDFTGSEEDLRLYMSDPVDLDGNGKVDGNDINIMQEEIKAGTNLPRYDINHDEIVDRDDLRIVQDYASGGLLLPSSVPNGQNRLPWIDITTGIDTDKNELYGETDHFSGFGVRR